MRLIIDNGFQLANFTRFLYPLSRGPKMTNLDSQIESSPLTEADLQAFEKFWHYLYTTLLGQDNSRLAREMIWAARDEGQRPSHLAALFPDRPYQVVDPGTKAFWFSWLKEAAEDKLPNAIVPTRPPDQKIRPDSTAPQDYAYQIGSYWLKARR